jgi:hypothetical protein
MRAKNLGAALRRDASLVRDAIIAVVFISFAGLAVASALLDFLPLRH